MISVIVSTYRAAVYIEETLRSIFTQTLPPLEIIVVDDSSPDETCALIDALRPECPVELRLIQLEKNSGGPAVPMNAGVAAARGEFIAMLDHDDRMLPQRLERALPFLARDKDIGIVFNQFNFFDEMRSSFMLNEHRYDYLGTEARKFSATEAYRNLITRGFPYGGAGGMLFRKAAWQDAGGFRPQYRIVWDYDFGLRTTASGWDTFYLPEILFQHRQHAGNLETSEGGFRILHEHLELFQDHLPQTKEVPELHRALQKKIENYVFRAADAAALKTSCRSAAYYYGYALYKGYQRQRAVRGFLRLLKRALTSSTEHLDPSEIAMRSDRDNR